MLLAHVLGLHSRYTVTDLQRLSAEMPAYLLGRAAHLNPRVAEQPERLARAAAAVAEGHDNARWRDAEIYYPIFTLAESGADAVRTEQLWTRLEIQLGLQPVDALASLPPAIYRLTKPRGKCYQVSDGVVAGMEPPIVLFPEWGETTVYTPATGLFADVLPAEHYGPCNDAAAAAMTASRHLAEALTLVESCSPELAADIRDLIRTIVLVPPRPRSEYDASPMSYRWSFNLRLRYFGAVFLELEHVDRYGALEGLVHEYYHQRCWQWWEIERPSGIPQPDVMMRSPVTGLIRSAIVMTQAFLIYVAIHELLSVVSAKEGSTAATGSWLEARRSHIAARIPSLYAALGEIVEPGTTIAAMLDSLMARFQAPNQEVRSLT